MEGTEGSGGRVWGIIGLAAHQRRGCYRGYIEPEGEEGEGEGC